MRRCAGGANVMASNILSLLSSFSPTCWWWDGYRRSLSPPPPTLCGHSHVNLSRSEVAHSAKASLTLKIIFKIILDSACQLLIYSV